MTRPTSAEPPSDREPEAERNGDRPGRPAWSRRSFLVSAGGLAAGGVLGAPLAEGEAPAPGGAGAKRAKRLSGEVEITLQVNGAPLDLTVEPRTTLLSALRHRAEPPLTGAKEVCARGNCGSCTVLVDGRPAYACLLLACTLEDREVTTVEGLGSPEALSPVQRAFWENDASMCGFCTPGFVVSTTACLAKHPTASRETLKRELAGNLCRCGVYPHLFEAAEAARDAGGGR